MMATRPSSTEDSGAAAAATTQEEKSIPGVSGNALKEERQPLLDLDDVEQLESELAACFDAPPPPPLNIRQEEQIATVSAWTPAAQPRYVETYVAPPTASVVAAAEARGDLPQPQHQQAGEAEQRRNGGERQQQLQQQQQRASTRVSDFSNLYSATPHRAESARQLYPALVPSAPSSEAMAVPMPHAAAATVTAAAAAATPTSAALSSITTATAVRQRDLAAGDVSSSNEVVEELLSENERLRLIIQDMSEELERKTEEARGAIAAASIAGGAQPTEEQSLALRRADRRTTGAGAVSATPAQRLLGRYPGAQAEAARRQREQASQQQPQRQQQQQQQQQQPEQQETTRPGTFVHFKCENCPQWLKVPGHAQLVYCPLCGHTSQMTANSIIHRPPNNDQQRPAASGGGNNGASGNGAAAAAGGSGAEEEVGWIGYFKSILAP